MRAGRSQGRDGRARTRYRRQVPGQHPLAGEQQVVGELTAEQQLGPELRDRQKGRPAEHVAERVGELCLSDRRGRRQIDKALLVDDVSRWVMAAIWSTIEIQLCHWRPEPDPAAEAELEQRKLFAQRATVGRQHDPCAEMHHARASGLCNPGCGLPSLAHLGEKPRAGWRVLPEFLVTTIAVETDRLNPTAAPSGRCCMRRSPRRSVPYPSCGW